MFEIFSFMGNFYDELAIARDNISYIGLEILDWLEVDCSDYIIDIGDRREVSFDKLTSLCIRECLWSEGVQYWN